MKTATILATASALLLSGVSMAAVAEVKAPAAKAVAESVILQSWAGPYEGVPPWDKVNVAEFPSAFQAAMDASKAEFEAMLTAEGPITFENTIIANELAGAKIDRLFSVWGVHSSNLSSDEVRKIQAEWEPRVSEFFSKLSLDARYFQRVKYLYDTRGALGLDPKQARLLERTYESAVRNGAMLTPAKKTEVIAIETDLAKRFSEFSNKVLADEETYILLTNETELAGLPLSFVAATKAAADAKGKTGWAIANTRSAVQPFLENSTNRPLREKIWKAFAGRGDNNDANDTAATIAEILRLRQARAVLLGFETHAHYRMADTMAKTPERAMELMMQVWPAAVARVGEEVADMQAIANADEITIAPWDYRFYAEKVRKAK